MNKTIPNRDGNPANSDEVWVVPVRVTFVQTLVVNGLSQMRLIIALHEDWAVHYDV